MPVMGLVGVIVGLALGIAGLAIALAVIIVAAILGIVAIPLLLVLGIILIPLAPVGALFGRGGVFGKILFVLGALVLAGIVLAVLGVVGLIKLLI